MHAANEDPSAKRNVIRENLRRRGHLQKLQGNLTSPRHPRRAPQIQRDLHAPVRDLGDPGIAHALLVLRRVAITNRRIAQRIRKEGSRHQKHPQKPKTQIQMYANPSRSLVNITHSHYLSYSQ